VNEVLRRRGLLLTPCLTSSNGLPDSKHNQRSLYSSEILCSCLLSLQVNRISIEKIKTNERNRPPYDYILISLERAVDDVALQS
jgi:hypothetical protein